MPDHSPRQRLFVALVLLAIGAAACDGTPAKPAAATQSKPPSNGAVTYDADRKVIVLVTPGPGQLGTLMQTWTWDGSVWTRKVPGVSPPARTDALLAYDESRRMTVLHGGQGRTGPLNDTWEWDGSNWFERQPAHSPGPAQQPGSLAYDPLTRQLLLFQWGRQTDASPLETWSWDGKDWALLKPAHVPDFFVGTLAFDGKRLVVLGASPQGNGLETWGWTGADWSLLNARHTILSPFLPAAFHAGTHKLVVYGEGPGDDTWTWDGTSWSREHPKRSPTAEVRQLVYDRALNRVVAFAGLDDREPIKGIYAWDGSDWSAVGPGSPPAVAAGSGLMPSAAALTLIRRTVVKTSPVLLPLLPAGVDQAQVTVDSTGFSLNAMNDDRSIEITMAIAVPGNSNLGADNKTIAFRRSSAYYQYVASDPKSWRSLWWTEKPGYWPVPGLKDPGVPYVLSATSMTEAEFFAFANTVR